MSLLAFVDLMTRLNTPTVIIGIIIAVVGFSLVILAKRIARAFRRSDNISEDDKINKWLKIIGLILILAGFILNMLP